ncbi:unnamed protein product [Oikopleura dioica]|uniref:Uncharacterized protein n=1 Tax=Oikopleura dioica TaxID=34765 RepID=E4WX08_OIKDI|nr:unnamed protein product [Oikopleura dioica]
MKFFLLFFCKISARDRSDCFFSTSWSKWSECSWLCGPHGTRERVRKRNCSGKVTLQKENKPCNNICFNDGSFNVFERACECKSGTGGVCCELFTNPGDEQRRCTNWFSPPKNGKLKCSRDSSKFWDWQCAPKCTNGFSTISPLPEKISCSSTSVEIFPKSGSLAGQVCTESAPVSQLAFSADLVYVSTIEPAVLESMILSADAEMAVPQGLLDTINFQCRKKAKQHKGVFKLESDFQQKELMLFDLALDLPEFEVAEGETDSGRSAVYGLPFSVSLKLELFIRGRKNLNLEKQNLAMELFQNCTEDLKEHFEREIATDESLVTAGDNVASQMKNSEISWNCPEGTVELLFYFLLTIFGRFYFRVKFLRKQPKKGHQLIKTAESNLCNKCPPGTIYSEKSCEPCNLGSYSSDDSCISCKPGQLTKNYPAQTSTDCFTPCSATEAVQFAFLIDDEMKDEDSEIIEEYLTQFFNITCGSSLNCAKFGAIKNSSSSGTSLSFSFTKESSKLSDIFRKKTKNISKNTLKTLNQKLFKTKLSPKKKIIFFQIGDFEESQELKLINKIFKEKARSVISISSRQRTTDNIFQAVKKKEDIFFLTEFGEIQSLSKRISERICAAL